MTRNEPLTWSGWPDLNRRPLRPELRAVLGVSVPLQLDRRMVVVTDGDQKVLAVDNPDALKGHEGHHVAVTGHATADSIHVDSAKML